MSGAYVSASQADLTTTTFITTLKQLQTWLAPTFEVRFGILVEFRVLEVFTFPSAKYHPYAYMSAD